MLKTPTGKYVVHIWGPGQLKKNNLKYNFEKWESVFFISAFDHRAIVMYKEHIMQYFVGRVDL